MKYLLTLTTLGLVACGQLVPDRVDVVNSGTSTIEVTASLRIIDQLRELCTDQLSVIDYPTSNARASAVSTCIFDHLNNIGSPSSALTGFVSQYCGAGANLAGLTPSQIASIAATCSALGK